ncbi:MAG: DUF4870 domain-containing protein [Candidatus Sulfotelmatobacter sp.]
MAVLAHALQMVGGWIAPLIIFIVKRNSRFVCFHALQALLLQVAYFLVSMFFGMIWFALIFSQVLTHAGQHSSDFPIAFFIVFPVVWFGFMVSWVGILVIVIIYSIKAGRGEWAEYPLIGGLARKMLGIGPKGSV